MIASESLFLPFSSSGLPLCAVEQCTAAINTHRGMSKFISLAEHLDAAEIAWEPQHCALRGRPARELAHVICVNNNKLLPGSKDLVFQC